MHAIDKIQKPYVDISIENDRFKIVYNTQKNGGALILLNKIEEVMRKKLPYVENSADKYGNVSQNELFVVLYQIAHNVRERYLEKHSCMGKVLGKTAWKSQKIKQACDRIQNLATQIPFLTLPEDVIIQHLLSSLQTRDMTRFAQVNHQGNLLAKRAQIFRAREYGFQGDDLYEARAFLLRLFQTVSVLVKKGYLSKENVFRKFYRIDAEATLQNLAPPSFNDPKKLYYTQDKLETIRIALMHRKTPNATDIRGDTPLHLAVSNSAGTRIVSLLLTFGANPNIKNNNGSPPIISATNQPDVLRMLLQKGAFPDPEIGLREYSALHFAALDGHLESAKILLECRADPNRVGICDNTPLHLAMENEPNPKMIELLLSYGADPNLVDKWGRTPLCINTKSPEIAKLLLEKGAHQNHQISKKGYAPLHLASLRGDIETVKVLLTFKADRTLLSHDGKTALDLASNEKIKALLK